MTQPTLTVELGYLSGWTLGESLLGTDTYLATVDYSQDISDLVRSVSIRRGRQHELNRVEAGTASVMVLNQDGAMTRIPPMTSIRVRAIYPPPVVLPDPGDVAGLVAWYDFSDISTLWQDTARTSAITADAQTIKGVTDLSGTGHHLSEATDGPQYKTAIQNGLSVARFDGTNDRLGVTGLTAPASGWTWFGVFIKRGALTASSQSPVGLYNGAAVRIQLFTNTGSHATGINYYANDAVGVTTNVATSPLSWGTKAVRANSTASMDIYTAGGTPVNLNPEDAVLTSQTVIDLAQAQNTNYADVDFAEMALYNVALGSTDMNTVGNYLAAKWAVSWTTV